jgi:hypothetical protein
MQCYLKVLKRTSSTKNPSRRVFTERDKLWGDVSRRKLDQIGISRSGWAEEWPDHRSGDDDGI